MLVSGKCTSTGHSICAEKEIASFTRLEASYSPPNGWTGRFLRSALGVSVGS
jgi:hypothetical protein